MPSDGSARPVPRPAPIRTPDQLQQSRRPDAARPAEAASRPPRVAAGGRWDAGVLGQLETERAHD